jgi:hypothetical protein
LNLFETAGVSKYFGDPFLLGALVVPRVRIELTTRRSSGVCSTTELPRRLA